MKHMWHDFINDFKELKKKKGFIYKLPSIITAIRNNKKYISMATKM